MKHPNAKRKSIHLNEIERNSPGEKRSIIKFTLHLLFTFTFV